jgi:hypothetical protein
MRHIDREGRGVTALCNGNNLTMHENGWASAA